MKYVTVVRYFTNSNIFAKKLSKTDLVIFIVYMCRLFILRIKDLEVVMQYITYYKKIIPLKFLLIYTMSLLFSFLKIHYSAYRSCNNLLGFCLKDFAKDMPKNEPKLLRFVSLRKNF